MNKMQKTTDVRVDSLRPLISPALLFEELRLTETVAAQVAQAREAVARSLAGQDDRLVVVVGPCSIHDPAAALEYAGKLKNAAENVSDSLFIVMRAYFEKPRTTVGWKGLINDPHLDGSFAINEGLRIARKLLCRITEAGMPVGCEFLDPISPQYTADLVSWGAIGARTTESQVHRELASGLSMPVGFKNGTDGNIRVAVDGVVSARHPHRFLGVTEQGLAAIVSTRGNPDCHIILRGSDKGPNYDSATIKSSKEALEKSGVAQRLMVDLSHGNSGKSHLKQPVAARAVAEQLAAGERGIFGVMMESFLVEGKQDLADKSKLIYGKSVTDACMSWETTVQVLDELAQAVRQRRLAKP
ncbi:MAG: 3-deoxy-7-phosphoheptulonate synthase [Deltaproteobacteria bacterium]|nr:3-deoxy-7-phosphoheptulonate synthase [Deltaproteobacteria bacterium]